MKKNLLEVITLLSLVGIAVSILKEIEVAVFVFLCVGLGSSFLKLKINFLKSLISKNNNPNSKLKTEISSKELGSRIKKARKEKEFTQEDLAKETGIARPNISRIESGKFYPSMETLIKIAKVLKISMGGKVNET